MVPLAGARGERALSDAPPVREDAWLSDALRRRVVRIVPDATSVSALREEAAASGERLLAYTQVPAHDVATTAALTASGMIVVDTAITLEAAPEDVPGDAPVAVEVAGTDLADVVGQLAGRELRTSRFHLDPWIPDADADALKRAWARNCVLGVRGREVLVVRLDGHVAGFLAVVDAADGARVIDLIATARDARRHGVGRALVATFAARHRDAPLLRVGTQAANVRSQAFYAALGFRPAAVHHVLHLHAGGDD